MFKVCIFVRIGPCDELVDIRQHRITGITPRLKDSFICLDKKIENKIIIATTFQSICCITNTRVILTYKNKSDHQPIFSNLITGMDF